MTRVLIFLIFLSSTATAQIQKPFLTKEEPPVYIQKKNIYRIVVTAIPNDEIYPVVFAYERQILKPLTVMVKAGGLVAISGLVDSFEEYPTTYSAFGSAELRYYWNLKRRIRKEKKYMNFSAEYISLEQYFISNALATVDLPKSKGYEGHGGMFLNLGFQRQFGSFYLELAGGPRIYGNDYGIRNDRSLTGWKAAVSIGLVL